MSYIEWFENSNENYEFDDNLFLDIKNIISTLDKTFFKSWENIEYIAKKIFEILSTSFWPNPKLVWQFENTQKAQLISKFLDCVAIELDMDIKYMFFQFENKILTLDPYIWHQQILKFIYSDFIIDEKYKKQLFEDSKKIFLAFCDIINWENVNSENIYQIESWRKIEFYHSRSKWKFRMAILQDIEYQKILKKLLPFYFPGSKKYFYDNILPISYIELEI